MLVHSPQKFQVKAKIIHSARQSSEEEQATDVIFHPGSELSKPELVDQSIEDPEIRSKIPEGEGNICISISAGDKLGDLSFNVQFEGTRGHYDFCVKEHNELLLGLSDWLQELLGEFDADFDVTLESKPCPKTDVRIALDLSEKLLAQTTNLAQAREELAMREENRIHEQTITQQNELQTKIANQVSSATP